MFFKSLANVLQSTALIVIGVTSTVALTISGAYGVCRAYDVVYKKESGHHFSKVVKGLRNPAMVELLSAGANIAIAMADEAERSARPVYYSYY